MGQYRPHRSSDILFQLFVTNFLLREENDVDDQLSGRLFDKVDGLEKASILNKISYNEKYGLDSTELIKRLKELEEEEAASA